jgi:hypothetical protein
MKQEPASRATPSWPPDALADWQTFGPIESAAGPSDHAGGPDGGMEEPGAAGLSAPARLPPTRWIYADLSTSTPNDFARFAHERVRRDGKSK